MVMSASAGWAQLAPPTATVNPAARSNMLAKTGGLIQTPISGPVMLFLNTQTRIPAAELQATADHIQRILRLPCTFTTIKGTREPSAEAAQALTDKQTASVIVICDSPSQPSLLVAPENRWALVNVAALGGQDVAANKLTERLQKELWRAFAYVMGAANSNFEQCLLKPVLGVDDLDALKGKMISPESFNKILEQAQKLGMQPTRQVTYRKAVEEGWAPAPTNDYQRTIWQEVKKSSAK
jgi:hypothetical protein